MPGIQETTGSVWISDEVDRLSGEVVCPLVVIRFGEDNWLGFEPDVAERMGQSMIEAAARVRDMEV